MRSRLTHGANQRVTIPQPSDWEAGTLAVSLDRHYTIVSRDSRKFFLRRKLTLQAKTTWNRLKAVLSSGEPIKTPNIEQNSRVHKYKVEIRTATTKNSTHHEVSVHALVTVIPLAVAGAVQAYGVAAAHRARPRPDCVRIRGKCVLAGPTDAHVGTPVAYFLHKRQFSCGSPQASHFSSFSKQLFLTQENTKTSSRNKKHLVVKTRTAASMDGRKRRKWRARFGSPRRVKCYDAR